MNNLDKKEVSEGKAIVNVFSADVVSKKLEVFYNPKMKFNRDISIALINEYFNRPIRVALPLAGSGVRGIRMFLECEILEILFNDLNPKAVKSIQKNAELNNINNLIVSNKDANIFLRENKKFDYIDIDPFGSSIYFIESAINSIKNGGVIAVTNTDTSALCGSYPQVTKRRYGSKPFNRAIRQQFGIRILIKKIQEIACMHDVALIPIFSYAKEHYMRVFFRAVFSKTDCGNILEQHSFLKFDENRFLSVSNDSNDLGPVWIGKLFDLELVRKIDINLIGKIKDDAIMDSLFYFVDPHEFCKLNKLEVPSYKKLEKFAIENKYSFYRTHFCDTAILTDIPRDTIIEIIKN
jgi:tRNA (guanine26-N2/guanine27-N2)-dimethyltransferase